MTNNSDPAFPIVERMKHFDDQIVCCEWPGVTKRELAAMFAMQGILANSEFLRNYPNADIHKLALINANHLLKALGSE